MASYIVDSSQVLSATTGSDSVWIKSAGAGASTVYGLAGNDTITVDQVNDASGAGTLIYTNAGADSIDIESANFSASNLQVRAGAGSDTITISGGGLAILNTNEDADLISISGSTILSASTFSTGAYSLFMESGYVDQLGLGNGHDIFTGGSVEALTVDVIKLGDGRDTISITSLTGVSTISLFGDNGSNANSDLIDLSTETGERFVLKDAAETTRSPFLVSKLPAWSKVTTVQTASPSPVESMASLPVLKSAVARATTRSLWRPLRVLTLLPYPVTSSVVLATTASTSLMSL